MSTVLLTEHRQQSTSIHPPDTTDREILRIPDIEGLRRLALADRLSLRLGVWLLHRSLHRPDVGFTTQQDIQRRALTEHEAITMLAHGLSQRRLL